MSNAQPPEKKISSRSFYNEYHGHKVSDLRTLYPRLRQQNHSLIWTAGDSSLDNKYWFADWQPAEAAGSVYAQVLDPPRCIADVTFWLNYLETRRQKENNSSTPDNTITTYAAINTAIEATTLNQRSRSLLGQDKFIRDNISSQDILIVSIGGNDVALAPTPCTIASISGLLCCLPQSCLENGTTFGTVPMDDCCCGCGPSLASCSCACPPCLGYIRHLFGTRVQNYIEKLTSKVKPKKILICMIYYPDEANVPSWANGALGALGYNSNPGKVQLLIRKMYEEATSRISIAGSEVIPIPLYVPLDGTRSEDYVARVEPSAIGGRKMAEYLLDVIHQDGAIPGYNSVAAPSTSFISGR
mmetsp:Transcript_10048/g.16593  ORF Transcript_10048/g.16593 Transcript_10048/m.16593 type:complete len:357 (+) Transcript_10048:99-1169(+)